MPAKRACALAPLIMAACLPASIVDLPAHDGETLIIVVVPSDETRQTYAYALEQDSPAPVLSVAEGSVLYALSYQETTTALQLGPDQIRPVPEGAPGRPLPGFYTSLQRTKTGEGGLWEDSVELDETVAEFRVPAFDYVQCIELAGCWRDKRGQCLIPCPEPPPPEAPVLPEVPCPAGWLEDAEPGPAGLTTCSPLRRENKSCGRFEAQFYGSHNCSHIGAPCPTTDIWPENLPVNAGPIVYVDPSAAVGGDGRSSSTPFRSLQTAHDATNAPAVIALSTGIFDERVVISRPGFTLIGACVDETVLTSNQDAALQFTASSSISNLSVGQDRAGIEILAGTLMASNVLVFDSTPGDGEESRGITVRSALIGQRIVARDHQAFGIGVFENSTADLDQIVLEGNEVGMRCDGGAVTARRSVVQAYPNVLPENFGILATSGCTLELSEALVRDGARGIGVFGATTSASLSDLVITEMAMAASSPNIRAIAILTEGAAVDLQRTLVGDGEDQAIKGTNGARLHATDLLIRNVRSNPGTHIALVVVHGDSVLELDRVFFDRNVGRPLRVSQLRASSLGTVNARDLLIRRDWDPEAGIHVQPHGKLNLTRALIYRSGKEGIKVEEDAEEVLISDVRIIEPEVGLRVNSTKGLDAKRLVIEGAKREGIYASQSSLSSEREAIVLRNVRVVGSGTGGVGLHDGSVLEMSQFVLEDLPIALGAQVVATFVLKDGDFARTSTAVRIVSDSDLFDQLKGVRFLDTGTKIEIGVTTRTHGLINVVPHPITLKSFGPGASTASVGVSNCGNLLAQIPLTITSATIRQTSGSGSAFSLTGEPMMETTLLPQACGDDHPSGLTWSVVFEPSEAGSYRAELSIASNDPVEPLLIVPVVGTRR